MGMKAESEHTSSKREQMKIVKDHLFENPKYYTLLKKAGLESGGKILNQNSKNRVLSDDYKNKMATSIAKKDIRTFYNKPNDPFDDRKDSENWRKYALPYDTRFDIELKNGGRVHRGSLVRDAKKGNTPARDLNNYNDVLDLDADGVYGAETGLYADGGNVNIWDKKDVTIVNGDYLKRAEVVPSYKDDTMKGKYFVVFRNEKGKIASSKDNFETYDLALKYAKDNVNNNQNYADGGDVKPYDANMDGDSADMMFARGGATDVIVNNWSDIPAEYKNVRLPKQIDWSPNPSNDGLYEIAKPFLSTDKFRPAMQGINFDDNGITITNTHILLTIPTDDHDFQGIYKPIKVSAKSLKESFPEGFAKIYEKYPNYERVIPTEKDITKVFQYININKLLTYCKVASNYTKEVITIRINDELMSFTPEYIIGLISSWIKLTGLSFSFVSFQNIKQALVFSGNPTFELGKNRVALLMPYIYGTGAKLGARNEDKKAELNVYFDFDDNEIHNSDGSVVTDWDEKPKKERAKRTPKTTASKTSKPIDLTNTKIWIGDNPELSKKVQEKAFELGWDWSSKNKTPKFLDGKSLYFWDDKLIAFSNGSKTRFDNDSKREIFESDLFGEGTKPEPKKEKTIDLLDKKIWVKDNPDLSRRVQELGFANGFVNSAGKTPIDTKDGNIFFTTKGGEKYMYILDFNKDAFDNEPETEIFESDLFPTETTTTQTEKIEVFRLVGLSIDEALTESTFGIYGATELLENLKLLESTFPEKQNFSYRIYDFRGTEYDTLNIGRGITTPAELITYIMAKPYYKDYDWTDFFAYGTQSTSSREKLFKEIDEIVKKSNIKLFSGNSYAKSSTTNDFEVVNYETGDVYEFRVWQQDLGSKIEITDNKKEVQLIKDYLEWKAITSSTIEKPVEQPKPSKTEKPKRNFELERKYLSQRISDLAKELELKKPILSNEEVAFYQREINSFILKLRKLNDAEMSLKSIEERVRGVYDLKISSFESEYPETDMVSINGLKSQLTEKEYFNVRTPEFKSFFGDWETAYLTDSYAGVSKVINPITKEPQPVFHGTNVLFVDWKTYDTNNAHYFAVKREMSEFFATTWEERSDKAGVDSEILKRLNPNRGSFLLRCFIDVKNPIDFSRFGVEKYPVREFLTFLRVNYNIGDFDFWTNITSHSGLTQDTEVYAWQIIRLWQSFTKYVKVFTTYDGYIFYEYIPTKTYGGLENASLSYCAFDSNQIKFTDAYEFNALSNDSRFDLGGIL
jgi:hypothetical protein